MKNICRKNIDNEDKYFSLIHKLVSQYFKCLIIIGGILFLIYIRKGISKEITIGKLLAYVLLASLVFVIIYLCDNFAYNNVIIGLGVYFGWELLKFN